MMRTEIKLNIPRTTTPLNSDEGLEYLASKVKTNYRWVGLYLKDLPKHSRFFLVTFLADQYQNDFQNLLVNGPLSRHSRAIYWVPDLNSGKKHSRLILSERATFFWQLLTKTGRVKPIKVSEFNHEIRIPNKHYKFAAQGAGMQKPKLIGFVLPVNKI